MRMIRIIALTAFMTLAILANLAVAMSEARAATTPVRIMPLGDSLTKGTGSPGLNGYRISLQSRLNEAGRVWDFVGSLKYGNTGDVDNEGHGGYSTARLLAEMDGWLAAQRPTFVLLHIGTNDLTAGLPAAGVAERLALIVRKVHEHNPLAHVYVAKIIGTQVAEQNTRTQEYNALIPGVVSEEKALYSRTYLVDMSMIGGQDLYDKRHPNQLGYEKMAYRWYQAIRATILGADNWPVTHNPWQHVHYPLCFWNYYSKTRSCAWYTRDYVNGVSTWIKD
jgi:lysophospholipase L1-like esterase